MEIQIFEWILLALVSVSCGLLKNSYTELKKDVDESKKEIDKVKEKYISREVFKEDLKKTEDHLKETIEKVENNLKDTTARLENSLIERMDLTNTLLKTR
jgi:predicted  nucleic acid-binding Zn-ribbon protein